ncbi:efflux RND transporter periplasmic adaptor subunit [Halodurantibacterium flavum]|uniref:Efflux RND transporter periplasmic adaptor subunit n=1 Tax=Halodurantibacterium flavum TaxID=1382802 RepID=A0ABW4S5N1_9RHOB
MRFLRRSLVGLFLMMATLGLLAMAVWTIGMGVQARMAAPDRPRPVQERVYTVNVVRAEPATVAPLLTAFGEVRSRRTLELRATVGGRVLELSPDFEDGATVAAGDLLVRIDPADAQSALDLAQADLDRAGAVLREAEAAVLLARDDLAAAEAQARLRVTALDRQLNLQARGVGTEAAVETAELAVSAADQAVLSRRQALAQSEAQLDQAQNTLVRQRITVAEAERRLRDTAIHAEFTGVVADPSVIEGGLVSPNERLAGLIDTTDLEVAFRISTSQYVRLLDDEGRLIPAEVTATLDVMGVEIEAAGNLTRVGAAVEEGLTGRLVYARLETPRGFRPGDFVTVRVREPLLEDVIVLPATALDSAGTVLALDPEDRLEVVPVTLLRRQGDEVIVDAGAEALAGREVVAHRSPMLGGGIRVRALRGAVAEAGPEGGEEAARPARGASQAAETLEEMVELSPDRRARLIALVSENGRIPEEARARIIAQLEEDLVPSGIIARIENRAGG